MINTGTLVLGLGHPWRGDDGVGPRLVTELADRPLPPGVTVRDGGTGGLNLLHTLEGWERVIVVDAADMGREPGTFVRFSPHADEARLIPQFTEGSVSLHDAGLSDVLALAEALGHSLPEMVIFGVQPAYVGWREGLSPEVEAILPRLIAAVLEEVKGENDAQDSGD